MAGDSVRPPVGPPEPTLSARAEQALLLVPVEPAQAAELARAVLAEAGPAARTGAGAAADGIALAHAERVLGMVARGAQDMVTAVTRLRRAVRYAERCGATALAGDIRISLALALAYLGRMGTALRELDRAAAVLDGAGLARVELQRASVLQIQGRLDDALERYRRALPLVQRAGDRAGLAFLHNNRGLLQSRRGALVAAEAELRLAVALHREAGNDAAAFETTHNVGLVAALRGDVPAALEAFDEVDRALAGRGVVDAVGLLDRAQALLAARLLMEARETAERALREQKRLGLSAYQAEVLLVLARIAVLDGRLEDARGLAERSARAFATQRRANYRTLAEEVAVRTRWSAGECSPALLTASRRVARALVAGGWTVAALDARLIAGQVAVGLGQRAVARAELGDLAVPRRSDPAELRARAFHARALLQLLDGDRRGAEAALRAAMAVVDRHRQTLGSTELRVHASGYAADAARLGLRLALQDRNPAQVLSWAERWRAGALGLRPVRPPEDGELAAALGEYRQVVHAQQEAAAAGDPSPRLLRRQAVLERQVQRLAWRHPAADRYHARQVSPQEIRAALGDRALVELVEADGMLHAVVLTARRTTLHRLCQLEDVDRPLSMLRFAMRRLAYRFGSAAAVANAEQSAVDAAQRLDELLLHPLAGRIGDRRLIVVPPAALHALPWAALPTCAGRPSSVAPSAAWWHRATAAAYPATAARGAASVTGRPSRVALICGPGLLGGAAEVDDLRLAYPDAACLTGTAATAAAVAAALDGVDLAHVAAHGSFRADQPLMSALQVADGPLTVYDLERLDRAPRCLVLASCDAGLSGVRPGDEIMGLAAALLAQGTGAIIAPLLPVPDTVTHPVVLALHAALRAGQPPDEALAAARACVADAPEAHVAATFVCIGAG